MSLNELVNLLILFALAVLIGIEIGKRQRNRLARGLTWHELSEMMREIERMFNTPHVVPPKGTVPDPFAEDEPLEHGAVTTVKRPDWDEAEVRAAEDREFLQKVSVTKLDPEKVDAAVSNVQEPPDVDGEAMTLMDRADAVRVHLANVTVVRSGMSGDVTVLIPDRPSVGFTHEEALELVAQGDAVGTVVAV